MPNGTANLSFHPILLEKMIISIKSFRLFKASYLGLSFCVVFCPFLSSNWAQRLSKKKWAQRDIGLGTGIFVLEMPTKGPNSHGLSAPSS